MLTPGTNALVSSAVVRLPISPTALIGRESDISQLCAQFERGVRLVTLIGPGGVGKTRLALAVAEHLSSSAFHDIAFVSLAPITDHQLVIPTIARTLGVAERSDQSIFDRLVERIHDRRLLLVLDNVEHVIPAADAIGALRADCPSLVILATSREPLHLSVEQEYPVMPLPLPEDGQRSIKDVSESPAIRLFVERASAVSPSFELTDDLGPVVSDICHHVGGLPLAIELAAARIKVLAPGELLERLESAAGSRTLALLTGGPRDAPDRQRTMRDTIHWSYTLLTADEQRALRQLSVFAGGWTLDAATAVMTPQDDESTDMDVGDGAPEHHQYVLDHLAVLIDKNLVQRLDNPRLGSRYSMLEPIRQFAYEALAQDESEAAIVKRRHSLYFASMIDDLDPRLDEPDTATLLDQVDAEHDNLRAVLRWSMESGDIELGLRMVGDLGKFWTVRDYYREALMHTTAFLHAPVADRRTIGRAKALWTACWLRIGSREREDVVSLADEARSIFEAHGDRVGLAQALFTKGIGHLFYGEDDQAVANWQRALPLFQEIGRTAMITRILGHLGEIARRNGDLDTAQRLVEEGLFLARSCQLPVATALSLGFLARIMESSGNFDRATELCHERLTLYLDIGMPEGVTESIGMLAYYAYRKGLLDRAACLLGIAERAREHYGDPTDLLLFTHTEYARFVEGVFATLRKEPFQAALTRGREMQVDDAMAFAFQPLSTAADDRSPTPPAELSLREHDVVRLLAAGKSNREIAAELFISPNTVATHVANILNKLGLESRTAVAAWAIRHGID